jgi:hypothetical protein
MSDGCKGLSMQTYKVTVSLALRAGYTAADAGLNSEEALGDYGCTVEADSPAQAEKRVLGWFHGTVPIGLLEAVDVVALAIPVKASHNERIPDQWQKVTLPSVAAWCMSTSKRSR